MKEKDLLTMLMKSCITAYFHPDKHRLNGDCYDENGKLKPEYQGSIEDYTFASSWEWFTGGNETGFTWYTFIDGRKTFVITLRGTYNMIGWATNFCAEKEDEPELNDQPWGTKTATGVAVHAGFHFGVTELMDMLLGRCRAALLEGFNDIIVTGHSRGAALSQGIAVGLQKRLIETEKLPCSVRARLFASPNYFNTSGAASYSKRVPDTIRVKNGTDPVANVPPAYWGFSPVGKEIRVGFEWYSPASVFEWLPAITAPIWGVRVLGTLVSGISASDHFPMRYLRNLAKLP